MPIAGYGSSGHGVVVSVEAAPVVAGTFVVISGVTSDLNKAWTRVFTKTTPHDKNVDGGVTENVIQRDPIDLEINYEHGTNHDSILFAHFSANTTFGLKLVSPSTGLTVIQSGELISWSETDPNEGPQKLMCQFAPSGPFKVDSTIYS